VGRIDDRNELFGGNSFLFRVHDRLEGLKDFELRSLELYRTSVEGDDVSLGVHEESWSGILVWLTPKAREVEIHSPQPVRDNVLPIVAKQLPEPNEEVVEVLARSFCGRTDPWFSS